MNPLRVLVVVDDEEVVRRMVAEVLALRGDDCLLATDGFEALRLLETHPVDVLVSDLSMPGMHGLELVRRVTALYPYTVSIVLTGSGTRADIITAIKESVSDFVEKPLSDPTVLSMAVARAGERSRLMRERDELLADLRRKNERLEIGLTQLRETYTLLKQQEEALESDLRQARRMQQRLLPARFPRIPGLEFFGFFRPWEKLGGDFFGVIPLPGHRVALYLADVAGHGVGAAMITVIVRELIHAHCMLHPDSTVFDHPQTALEFLNRGLLEEDFDPPILVTMIYAVFDARTGEVTAGCAGHPPLILVTGPETTSFLPAHGPALGITARSRFVTARFSMLTGDFVLLYSDGLSEARDPSGEVMSEDRLAEFAASLRGHSAREVGHAIEHLLEDRKTGLRQDDDETFLVVGRSDRRGGARPPHPETETDLDVHIVEPATPSATLAPSAAHLLEGWHGDECVLAVRGRATWRLAPSLCAAIAEAIDLHARLIHLDLAPCAQLDSTILGVLHQYASRLTLHRPSERLLSAFQELEILPHLHFGDQPLPQVELVECPVAELSREEQRRLMLSAHESLAEASEANRAQFDSAIATLRKRPEGERK